MQLKRGVSPLARADGGPTNPASINTVHASGKRANAVTRMEVFMTLFSRRSLLASAVLAGLAPTTTLFAADSAKEIRIDWATYNPVSMLLKEKGLLEKEFAKDGITVRWV